jgi:hypothetical protein
MQKWIEYVGYAGWVIGLVGSIASILSYRTSVSERRKRAYLETYMLGFLHGMKPIVEAAAQPNSTPQSFMQSLIPQINDALSRLQPPDARP